MIVITLTDCPPALRGDLTKWLQEVNTGVYVGRVSARVRDMIWKRVRESANSGRATMVFGTNNEQRMDFRVHNTSWEPIDFDGLKLILRPSPARIKRLIEVRMGYSKAARIRTAKQMSSRKRQDKPLPKKYVAISIETTGSSAKEDHILTITIKALMVCDGEIHGEFHCRITPTSGNQVHSNINDDQNPREIALVLPEFLEFVGDLPVVSHNSEFLYGFLRTACERCGLPLFSNQCVDTIALTRRLLDDVKNYKIETILEHFKIEALNPQDCLTSIKLYDKLIELQQPVE